MANRTAESLGPEAESLLGHECRAIPKEMLHWPGPAFIDEVFALSERLNRVLRDFQAIFDHGRLGGTGYLSILPAVQGIEHSAGFPSLETRSVPIRGASSSWRLRAAAEGDNPPRLERIAEAS